MKIKDLKLGVFIITILAILISCGNDDDAGSSFQERDRTEQQAADSDSLQTYLSTHYYNSSFFETSGNHSYSDIIITELQEGESVPTGNILLIDAPNLETHTVTYAETEYEYYILRLNQGQGGKPKFTDAVRARYEGISVESGETFDLVSTPVNFSLTTPSGLGVIKGWELVMPQFETADGVDINEEGIVEYTNYGLGAMFIPSGLGYFSRNTTGSTYDNLVFKFELLQFEEIDHDGDGIPSHIEDRDGDRDVFNDDTDDDDFANFVDGDDDDDDVSTINELIPTTYIVNPNDNDPDNDMEPILAENEYEISRSEDSGIITINTVTIADDNGDGIPDYLDAGITKNYNEEN